LNSGISKPEILNQGLYYFQNSFNWDPLTLVVIFTGITIPFIVKEKYLIPVAMGIILYLLFILQMGGDFMSGRFFAAPLFVAVILLAQCKFKSFKRIPLAGFSCLIILLGFLALQPPILSDEKYGLIVELDNGIADERGWYYEESGLLNSGDFREMPGFWGGEDRKKSATYLENPTVATVVGWRGYIGGPQINIIDCTGLGDPLLSKFPPPYTKKWRIGHFQRPIPLGYYDTIKYGQNMIEDPNLAEYYDKISIITKGRLFDANRLQEIWNINTGKYDSLLDAYIHSQEYKQTPICKK